MSEITKLYENAKVERELAYFECHRGRSSICCPIEEYEKDDGCMGCINSSAMKEVYEYPPFTAEKQLAIENIIFQCNFGVCELQRTMPAEFTKENRFVKHYFFWEYHAGDIGYYDEITEEPYGDWDVEYSNPNREEALAGFVNALWDEHLTEEEQQQVKGILE